MLGLELLIGTFTGVLGNAVYNTFNGVSLEESIMDCYEKAEKKFLKRYGNQCGDKLNTFLVREANRVAFVKSFNYANEEISVSSFDPRSFREFDNVTQEVMLDFINLLKIEINKNAELSKIIVEKNHIEEQKLHIKDEKQFNNELKEDTKRILKLLSDNIHLTQKNNIDWEKLEYIYECSDIIEQDIELTKWLYLYNHKEGLILKAFIYEKREELVKSRKIYEFIVDEFSEKFYFNNIIGIIHLNSSEFEEAEKRFLRLLNKDTKNIYALFNLGVLYGMYLKEYGKSREYFMKALEITPDDSEILNNLGIVMKNGFNDHASAKEYFELAIKYSKNNELPFINLGDLYLDTFKDYEKSIKCYEGGLLIAGNNKETFHNFLGLMYGSILFKQKKLALDHFNKALKINPNFKEAKINREILLTQGYFDMLETFSSNRRIDLLE